MPNAGNKKQLRYGGGINFPKRSETIGIENSKEENKDFENLPLPITGTDCNIESKRGLLPDESSAKLPDRADDGNTGVRTDAPVPLTWWEYFFGKTVKNADYTIGELDTSTLENTPATTIH